MIHERPFRRSIYISICR